MKIVVTGGAGFIGSAVVRLFLAQPGMSVVNVDKLTYAGNPTVLRAFERAPNYAFEKVDISDREAMAAVFDRYQPDAMVHLAAETHVDRSIDGPRAFVETNLVGTYVLLETVRGYLEQVDAARRARFRFVDVSTDEVYGSLGAVGAFSETSRFDPSSPYAATKAGADHLVQAWHRTYGVPAIISHCSNNFGPYQFPEKLIPLMIINGLEGRDLPVYGDGRNVRDWVHVDDHARALLDILRRGRVGETYNVGGGCERSNIEIVRAICRILDRLRPRSGGTPHAALIRFVEDRPGHDLRYAIDLRKLTEELGWRPRVSLEDALEETIRWYLDNERWWRAIREGAYRGERLGVLGASDTRQA